MSIKFRNAIGQLVLDFNYAKFRKMVYDKHKGKRNERFREDVRNYYAYVHFIMEGVEEIQFGFTSDAAPIALYNLDNLFLGKCPSRK